MSYEYIKAVCLFCDENVEGAEEFMRAGKRYDHKGGHPEKWLKEKPEHKWAWNGLTSRNSEGQENSAKFYLCPDHQTGADFKLAFRWATEHSERIRP